MLPTSAENGFIKRLWMWISNHKGMCSDVEKSVLDTTDYIRLGIYILFHAGIIGVFFAGVSTTAVIFALAMYLLRMFFITGFYHRYFSHKSFRSGRFFQWIMAFAGCTAGQRGPLWWASHHRYHHLKSDTNKDPHTPQKGFLESHLLWIFRKENFNTNQDHIRDLARYPELVVLSRFHWVPFMIYGYTCYLTGELLNRHFPQLDTDGTQLLIWGFFISTVCLYHGTYTINSLAHKYGKRRFETKDDSKNNTLLALITLGEGWHNNHHRYPVSARQGFYWWEVDLTYIALKIISYTGLIGGLRPVPYSILMEGKPKTS
jgi:stearoyl-CoA desaturase (delta-9 desaturase)